MTDESETPNTGRTNQRRAEDNYRAKLARKDMVRVQVWVPADRRQELLDLAADIRSGIQLEGRRGGRRA